MPTVLLMFVLTPAVDCEPLVDKTACETGNIEPPVIRSEWKAHGAGPCSS